MEEVEAQNGTKRPREDEGEGGGEDVGFFIDKTGQDPAAEKPPPKVASGPKYELPPGWAEFHHQWGLPFFVHEATGAISVTRPFMLPRDTQKEACPIPYYVLPRPAPWDEDTLQPPQKRPKQDDTGPTSVDDYRAYWTFLNELYKEARRRMKPGTAQEEVGDEDLGEISIPQLLKKPPLVALNEYCALVLKTKPVLKEGYTLLTRSQSEDSKVTHSIQVEIDGRAYGQGNANTKKKARQLAAMNTLEMLFPDLYKVDPEGDTPVVQKPVQEKYDRMDIRDPTLADGYEADNVRAPYLLLQSYMSRYRRHEDPEVKMIEVDPSHSEEDAEKFNANFRFKFEMTYDNITVSDYARSKKHARQRGSQLIMAELHPTLRFWGSVLRMYDQTRELFRERSDEKDLADLALRGNFDKPNVELLERLKTDMRRLYPNRPKEGPTPVPTSAGEILERHWLPDGETGLLPLGRYQPRMERQEERFLKELEDVERREAQVVEELEKEKKN